jgi:hypothetical protein
MWNEFCLWAARWRCRAPTRGGDSWQYAASHIEGDLHVESGWGTACPMVDSVGKARKRGRAVPAPMAEGQSLTGTAWCKRMQILPRAWRRRMCTTVLILKRFKNNGLREVRGRRSPSVSTAVLTWPQVTGDERGLAWQTRLPCRPDKPKHRLPGPIGIDKSADAVRLNCR